MKNHNCVHIAVSDDIYELLSIRAKAHNIPITREATNILTRSLSHCSISPLTHTVSIEQESERDEEAEKRNLPPTPPIKSKGEEEEKEKESPPPHARARDELVDALEPYERQRRVANVIPTLEQALSFAACKLTRLQCTPEMVREWYAVCEASQWCDKDGNPIHNWGYSLHLFARYYEKNKRSADPNARMIIEHISKTRPVNVKVEQLKGEDYVF